VDIVKVISLSVVLKKGGVNYVGKCPFHTEGTGSFTVSPAKGIFKCFGCGKAGDAVSFVMEFDKLSYPEALRKLAAQFNVEIEEDKNWKQPTQEEKDELTEMDLVTRAAQRKWASLLVNSEQGKVNSVAKDYLTTRGISQDSIIQWGIGFAPDEWRFLTPLIIESGKWAFGEALGLVANSNEKNYDVFRNRIMFPIHDEKGVIVGFGGRLLPKVDESGLQIPTSDKDGPKYLNPGLILCLLQITLAYSSRLKSLSIFAKQIAITLIASPFLSISSPASLKSRSAFQKIPSCLIVLSLSIRVIKST
jgi:DNA primase